METALKIDLSKIRKNYQYVNNLTKGTIAAVVKADGYGIGALCVAKTLQKIGCREYFVSSLEEAINLRTIFYQKKIRYMFSTAHTPKIA